jgi:hypothetical protein
LTNPASICLLTPTQSADIRQFAALRRSLELFAPDLPHIAIVNTEDHGEFAERFHHDSRLRILKTAEVLPSAIERHRRRTRLGWLTARWLRRRVIRGGHIQQLSRLYGLANCPYEAAAFIDSDTSIGRPFGPGYFYVDGQLKLFRRPAVKAESLDADIATHEILGNPLHQVTDLFDYRFSPACFRRSSAARLLAEFQKRGRSRWVRRFIAQQRPSVYNLLGYSATVLEGGAGYRLVDCTPQDAPQAQRVA